MKNKGKLIYSGAIILLILSIVVIKLTNSKVDNESLNKKVYSSSISTANLGEWTLEGSWLDLSDNDNVEINGTHATVNATTNIIEDNEITYQMHISYEGGTATSDFENETENEGMLLMLKKESSNFPFYMRDEISEYDWVVDANNNRIILKYEIYPRSIVEVAYIYFNDVVHESKVTNQDFGWRISEQYNDVEIFNTKTIPAANDFEATFKVTFSVIPSFVYDSQDTAESFVPYTWIHNADEAGEFSEDTPSDVHVSINGYLSIDNIVKSETKTFSQWNSDWGTNPDNGGNYFYVAYSVEGSINATQPFNMDPDTKNSFIIDDTGGEIVAFSDGSTFMTGDMTVYLENEDYAEPGNDFNYSTYSFISNEVPTTSDFSRIYIVKYPDTGGVINTHFSLDIIVDGVDKIDDVVETVEWDATYVWDEMDAFANV